MENEVDFFTWSIQGIRLSCSFVSIGLWINIPCFLRDCLWYFLEKEFIIDVTAYLYVKEALYQEPSITVNYHSNGFFNDNFLLLGW